MSDSFRILLAFFSPFLLTPLAAYALYSLIDETQNTWKTGAKKKKIIVVGKIYLSFVAFVYFFYAILRVWP